MGSPISLPPVGRIQGAVLHRNATEQDSRVQLQYTDHSGKLYELWIPFLDAMYLRNILNSCESDAAFGAFDKPRT